MLELFELTAMTLPSYHPCNLHIQVLELFELTGTAVSGDTKAAISEGDSFLQQTADEISKQVSYLVITPGYLVITP